MASRLAAYRPRPRPEQALPAGPFTRVVESNDPTASTPDALVYAYNMLPLSVAQGAGWWGRPGYARERGFAGGATPQAIGEYDAGGGAYLVVIYNGTLEKQKADGTWSGRVIPGIKTSGRVYITQFGPYLVISDGVNRPVAYHTTDATVTTITACPPLLGPPVVYYGKLVGVSAATSPFYTIVWSEEGDIFTGYGALGSDNAWDFKQTSQEGINWLISDNDGLWVFREHSIALIQGPTEDAFTSAGTREGISETVGASRKSQPVRARDKFFFFDAELRPQMYVRGGGVVSPPLAEQCQPSLEGLRAFPAWAPSVYWESRDIVVLAARTGAFADNYPEVLLTFSATDGRYLGVWRFAHGPGAEMIVSVKAKGGRIVRAVDSTLYVHGTLESGPWTDSGVAIEHRAVGPFQGYDTAYDKKFSRLDLSIRAPNRITELAVETTTSHGKSPELALPVQSGQLIWGQSSWGHLPEPFPNEQKVTAGLDAFGRWCRLQVRHRGLNEQFGLEGWTLTATATDRNPRHR